MLERRNVAGDVAAHSRVLDLDYLGAQVREHLGAERSGSELRDGQDAYALEGWPPGPRRPLIYLSTRLAALAAQLELRPSPPRRGRGFQKVSLSPQGRGPG